MNLVAVTDKIKIDVRFFFRILRKEILHNCVEFASFDKQESKTDITIHFKQSGASFEY